MNSQVLGIRELSADISNVIVSVVQALRSPVYIKRFFRREPVISTVVTAGTVNILLGMLEGQALLAFIGILVVSGTLALRGWQKFLRPIDFPEQAPIRYLPDETARPPVPMMGLSSRRNSEPD
jgi:phosphoribosylcarboxyaminoimidazole (NCAIR) mutase